ncbi:hypothetical protein WDV86_15935, partial [Pseudokineococcus sp. 1T1Z-3]|uniref:hypothetical protein n=1 Tax=Pseudokineococcus sp. 1T1Z-3 TaxID=3132745 RepID=UPI0030ABF033
MVTVLTAMAVCTVIVVATASRTGADVVTGVVAVAVGVCFVGVAALAVARRPDHWSGPADRITLARTVLGGGVATLVTLDALSAAGLGPSWAI